MVKVVKWGNSLAIRFPKEIVDILQLKEGQQIDIRRADLDTGKKKKPLSRAIRARLRKYEGKLPPGWKIG
jgi:antitoxin MazE